MKFLLGLSSTLVLSLALFLIAPNIIAVFAQTSSGCALIKVGTPPENEQLPVGCTGGGAQKVIELAKQQLGDPYVWGTPTRNWKSAGANPSSFDCSGLVGWAWYTATGGKVNFPGSTSATWGNVDSSKFQTFTPAQKDQIQPGDAIYWGTSRIHHTALYEGPGNCGAPTCIIEAQQTGVPVKESSFEGRINGSDKWLGFIRPINY